jgi:hypothetical protein
MSTLQYESAPVNSGAVPDYHEQPLPHPGGCEGCRSASQCNACGIGVSAATRCTTGRCSSCCNRRCRHGR